MEYYMIFFKVGEGALGEPCFYWRVGKQDGSASKPLGGLDGGMFSLETFTLEQCVKEMIKELHERQGPKDEIYFFVGDAPWEEFDGHIEGWKQLEKQGYPRFGKEQAELLEGYVKKYHIQSRHEEMASWDRIRKAAEERARETPRTSLPMFRISDGITDTRIGYDPEQARRLDERLRGKHGC